VRPHEGHETYLYKPSVLSLLALLSTQFTCFTGAKVRALLDEQEGHETYSPSKASKAKVRALLALLGARDVLGFDVAHARGPQYSVYLLYWR
jgi:hypothetical protein